MRTGFSLVECLVASVLLSVGLLAIASSHRAVQRLDLLAGRTAAAAALAESRFAVLRSAPCAAASGTALSGPFDERWSVASGVVRDVSVEIHFQHDGRLRAVRYDGALLCLP